MASSAKVARMSNGVHTMKRSVDEDEGKPVHDDDQMKMEKKTELSKTEAVTLRKKLIG